MNVRDDMGELLDELKQQRDELKLRSHLFNLEVKDEWEDLEGKWQHFKSQSQQVAHATGDAGSDVLAAARMLGSEILNGYRKIAKVL